MQNISVIIRVLTVFHLPHKSKYAFSMQSIIYSNQSANIGYGASSIQIYIMKPVLS